MVGPDVISDAMLRKWLYCLLFRVKYNLNELSYDTVFDMIKSVKEHVKLIDHVTIQTHFRCMWTRLASR